MAENVLETRILLRYGTYSQWMNSDVILGVGEAAICVFPNETVIDSLSNTSQEYTPPAVGIKIGDGYHYFSRLPWVQAVAADVYNWAKSSSKPTYTAAEISGLDSYLEENFHISGDITIAPRIYQIVQGTGENANKYYLRYKESNEEGQWITDTNHAIDLTDYAAIKSWISLPLESFPTLANFTAYQTRNLIATLATVDTAVNKQFVTSVSQSNGIIEVTRAQPSFDDISGTLPVSQGGTGKTNFPEDSIITGNGTNALSSIPISEELNNTNIFVPAYTIKNYIDNATAGLTGAMHFIGEATVVIRPNSSVNPNIRNYDFSNAQPGDVILYNSQEFVWDGSSWILLGDEGSYAVKGSIRDIDIAEDAEIQQSKISNLSNTFNTKVDKIEGKTLTSNDFTDELKQKLESLNENADVNTIEHILLNGTEVLPTVINSIPKTVNLQIQEFDDQAQSKLSNIEAEAQVNKIEKIIYDGTEIIPDENKAISITSDPHTDHINKIESIFINGREWLPNAEKQVKITIDQAALDLNVLEGAIIPGEQGGTVEVPQTNKKLELERIAVSGDVKELKQTADTYIILDCGSSTTVI